MNLLKTNPPVIIEVDKLTSETENYVKIFDTKSTDYLI
jgi:hypothetical protein